MAAGVEYSYPGTLIYSLLFMGRPKLDHNARRSVNLIVRLTNAEKTQIEKAAATCGVSPGVMVREKLFKGKFPQARIARIELDTFLELKKIGVNLNQLTRLAHAGRINSTFGYTLNQLLKQQQLIITQLLRYDSHSENR